MPAQPRKKTQARKRTRRAVVSRVRSSARRSRGARAVGAPRSPAQVRAAGARARARIQKTTELVGAARKRGGRSGSEPSDECYTPRWVSRLAREVLVKIDLDPASCAHANRRVRARRWYGKKQDGLKRRWRGRVFLNFPFSRPLPWVQKLIASYDAGDVTAAFVVCNARTGSGWFNLLTARAYRRELTKRIRFWGPATTAKDTGRMDQMLFYLGPHPERFAAATELLGRLIPPTATQTVTLAAVRTCEVCKRSLEGRRSHAKTCGGACREQKRRDRIAASIAA